MIIAIDKKLKKLKKELEEMGYDAVVFGEYNYPIDAVVFAGITGNLINNTHVPLNETVLYVDSRGKTAREVSDILQKKLYSPLFFE